MDHRQIVSVSSGGSGSEDDLMEADFLRCGRRLTVELNINRATVEFQTWRRKCQCNSSSRVIALVASGLCVFLLFDI
jgi:DNA-binding transcriptional LysR family regulator